VTDPKTIVRQGLERVEFEPFTLTTFHARRERRRRNQRLAAGAVGGLIVIVMAILTVGALTDARPTAPGGPPNPATHPAPTVEFSSPIHGYALDHPEGWHVNPTTIPWTTGGLDRAYADLLLGAADAPMMEAGSMPIPDGMTTAEWLEREGRRASELAGLGGSGCTYRPTPIDGEPAQLSESCNVVLVVKDRRGYVFRFHASLATNTDLREVVRSIELHPEDAGT
jgi:hypothetical protein